jgi:A/G-specific adenine glycosylase
MAQQTQVLRAAEKWTAFLARYPTVEALAGASPADVLRAWRGLGYNRRALNLWRAAGVIVERHGGRVPGSVAALEQLPGVGPYTARAVAAIAFGLPVGAVDTNVRRVLGRIVGGVDGVAPGELQVIADAAVPADRPGEWTHAVMDIGARLCRPRNPDCPACPAVTWCRYATSAVANASATAPATAPAQDGPPRQHSGHRLAEPARPTLSDRPARSARTPTPFSATSRWLRGRLLDRLRDEAADGWVTLAGGLGPHGAEAVARALRELEKDGLVELDPDDPGRARLPVA